MIFSFYGGPGPLFKLELRVLYNDGQVKVKWSLGAVSNVKSFNQGQMIILIWSGECQLKVRWRSNFNLSLTLVDVKLVIIKLKLVMVRLPPLLSRVWTVLSVVPVPHCSRVLSSWEVKGLVTRGKGLKGGQLLRPSFQQYWYNPVKFLFCPRSRR